MAVGEACCGGRRPVVAESPHLFSRCGCTAMLEASLPRTLITKLSFDHAVRLHHKLLKSAHRFGFPVWTL